MELTADHQAKLEDVLKWRRDVRHFKQGEVPEDIWRAVKHSIAYAPSVGNSQPWRMVEVTSPGTRAAIIAQFEAENASASLQYEARERADYLALKLAGLKDAPIHLAVFTDTAPAQGRGLGRQTMPETLQYSTVTAIYTLWLAARAYNLGVGWVSIVDPRAVTQILDVPSAWSLTAYLCIGYPSKQDDTPELQRRDWQARGETLWQSR